MFPIPFNEPKIWQLPIALKDTKKAAENISAAFCFMRLALSFHYVVGDCSSRRISSSSLGANIISVRRLRARPSGVLLLSMGS